MELAKTGNIGKICVPNALATFKEYVNDFANPETKAQAIEFIRDEMENEDENSRKRINKMIKRVDDGERDVFF